jgi:hypothetical protein
MLRPAALAALAAALTVSCTGSDTETGSAEADVPDTEVAAAADLPDPCTLVADEKISELLWQSMGADQRPGMEARNATHTFTKRVENVDFPAGRTCFYQYKRVAADTVWSEGDFILRTLGMDAFKMFADANGTHEPITGAGDEAFYFQNAAYGRRGDVGVEVVEFGSQDVQTEMLKEAIAGLP